jgi:hypothetical protein
VSAPLHHVVRKKNQQTNNNEDGKVFGGGLAESLFGVAVDGDGGEGQVTGGGEDSFDLESILSLVEEAEADEVERRISTAPGRAVVGLSVHVESS